MEHEPQVQQRAAQPYVAISAHIASEAEFRQAADSGFPELFGWLRERGIEPSGAPFIRFLVFDVDGQPRAIELAVPVTAEASGDGRIRADVLPAGRYVTFLHVGPYRSATVPDLAAAHAALQDWAKKHSIVVDSRDANGGSALAVRFEQYHIGPLEEPDHSKWETELAYLTAEG